MWDGMLVGMRQRHAVRDDCPNKNATIRACCVLNMIFFFFAHNVSCALLYIYMTFFVAELLHIKIRLWMI